MMTKLTFDVIRCLEGKTLSVAESCTGGMLGAALTGVSGSSAVFKGGVISYTNEIKANVLKVPAELLDREGAVSRPVAEAMAAGVRELTDSYCAVSVTGLAGPGGDEYGNPVGTVFVGYADDKRILAEHYVFTGDREEVRQQAAEAALKLILLYNREVIS